MIQEERTEERKSRRIRKAEIVQGKKRQERDIVVTLTNE